MRDDLLFEGDSLFVSKKIKQIDSNIGYKKENQTKLVKNLQESNKEKNKEILIKNKQIHLELMKRRAQKMEEMKRRENSRNNIHQLNLISSPYNLQFLPKISPFIQSIDNILVMDSKKAEKVGSKGFEYIWKQEKLLKLSNIKPEEIISNTKENKHHNKHKNIHSHIQNNIHNDELDDIFDSNYNERKKVCDEVIELKERLNRIINQNKKVNTKFNLHKAMALKFRVKKIYHPKYESIEKHKPVIILYNRTRRIFPENLIQKRYYIDNDNKPYTTINKDIKDKKMRNISRDKRKTYYICSSLSLNEMIPRSVNNNNINNNINERNKFLKNRVNMKLTSFTIYDNNNNNKSNTLNQNSKNNSNTNIRKSKSQISIFEK